MQGKTVYWTKHWLITLLALWPRLLTMIEQMQPDIMLLIIAPRDPRRNMLTDLLMDVLADVLMDVVLTVGGALALLWPATCRQGCHPAT